MDPKNLPPQGWELGIFIKYNRRGDVQTHNVYISISVANVVDHTSYVFSAKIYLKPTTEPPRETKNLRNQKTNEPNC